MFYARKPDDPAPSQNINSVSEEPESEFERVLKARDELLEGLAHDLKNALSSIIMNTSLARRVVPASGDASSRDQCVLQMVERIEEASDRIRKSMQDALDMTGCISGNLNVTPVRREVKVLVGDVLAQLEAQRKSKNITLNVTGSRDGLTVIADHEKVPTALSRLLGYGIKISLPSSELELKVESAGDEVQFRMMFPTETVSIDQLKQIFDRQGKRPGLFLVRGIAEIFDGRTWTRALPDGRAELGMSLKSVVRDDAVRQLVQS